MLWLRVDPTEIDGISMNYNFTGWGIRSDEWKRYGITCRVLDDAETIVIGAFAVGSATVWVDDFQIEIVEPKETESN
jgi:hypothetical protein